MSLRFDVLLPHFCPIVSALLPLSALFWAFDQRVVAVVVLADLQAD
ncbi:MAG: hypothetical protein R6U98_17995 [Pirellulaceae bacterium]